MGRMASKQGWLHLSEVSFIRSRSDIKNLRTKLRQNQVLLASVTKVKSASQAQVNLRGVEVLCDTPYELKAGSRIYVQVKELVPQIVLKLISLRENNPFWQQLKKEEISQLLQSFNLPLNEENSLIANELFKNGLLLSPESILEIKHDLISLMQLGVIQKGADGSSDLTQIIRLLIFLRSRGIAPTAATLSLAQRAFQFEENLPLLLRSLMGDKAAGLQPLKTKLANLFLTLPAEELAHDLARQLADFGWFYERKLLRSLDKKGVDFTQDLKHHLGRLIASKSAGNKAELIQDLWEILTARSLRNLPQQNLPQGEISFPVLFFEDDQLRQAYLRLALSSEGDSEDKKSRKDNFCLAFFLELSALGPLMLIAEIRGKRDVYLDFQVASDTIKDMMDGQAKKLEAMLKAHGFAVKRWRTLVRNISVEQFLSKTLSSRWKRWGKVDFLV